MGGTSQSWSEYSQHKQKSVGQAQTLSTMRLTSRLSGRQTQGPTTCLVWWARHRASHKAGPKAGKKLEGR